MVACGLAIFDGAEEGVRIDAAVADMACSSELVDMITLEYVDLLLRVSHIFIR